MIRYWIAVGRPCDSPGMVTVLTGTWILAFYVLHGIGRGGAWGDPGSLQQTSLGEHDRSCWSFLLVCVLQDVASICLVCTDPFQPFLFAKVKCREGFRLFVATLIQYSSLCTYGIHLSGVVERVFLHGWVSTKGIHWIYCALVCLFVFIFLWFFSQIHGKMFSGETFDNGVSLWWKKREFLSGEMNSIPWLRGILWHNWTSAEVSSKAPTRPGWWVDASVEWNMFTIAHDLLGKTIVSCRCFLRHKPCDFGSLTLLASTSSVCPLSQP